MLAALTVVLLVLTSIGMPIPAAAVGVACAGPAQNGLTITPTHDPTFYVDLPDFDASYLGYKIDNSGASRSNLWVTVGNFTGGSVSLDEDGDNQAQIPSLPAGGTDSAFFMVKAVTATATPQAHDVTVYDRRPDLAGASVVASCTFTFAAVASTIAANANQVNAVTSTPAAPALGQTVTMVVDGKTGQANGAVWVSPAANASWPSKALRLEQTRIEVNVDGLGPIEQTFVDTLYIPAATAAVYTSKTTYQARYTFRATQALTTSPAMKPVAQISSGGQFKHTGSYPTLPVVSVSSSNAGVIAGKTITATDLTVLPTTTSPNGVPGTTTYAEVPYRITASASGGDASVDELVDVPDTGVLFKAGSARITDATPRVNAVLGDPLTSAADTGVRAGALHFTGPFPVSTTIPITLTYVMYVPVIADTYTNEAFAAVNSTILGSGPNLVPIVTVTTDGTGVTGFTVGNAGTGTTTQTILFGTPADRAANATNFTVTPTASSGLPVSVVSMTPDVCTVTGAVVDVLSAGTCTLVGVQLGNATYAAADPVTVSFQATLVPQAITFPTPADRAATAVDFDAGATSDSGLAVYLTSSTPSVCVISDGLVDVLGTGTCTLVGSQPGTAMYAPATPVQVSFAVSVATQSIAFAPISDRGVNAPNFTVTPSATSGLPVTITSSTPTVCTIAGGIVDVLATGTCTLTATQGGNSTYGAADPVSVSFEVAHLTQTITFPSIADQLITGDDFPVQASSDSALPVTVTSTTPAVCTVDAGTLSVVSPGTCTLTATQTGNSTYAAADPVVVSFDVLPIDQQITFPTPGTMVPTDDPFTVVPTSDSGLPVTVTSSTADICTVTGGVVTLTGEEGTCTLVATQPGDPIYAAAPAVEVSFTVGRAAQTITFDPISDTAVNADDFPVDPIADSGLPVTVTTTTPTVCSVIGGLVDVHSEGTCTLVATRAGTATFTAADPVEVSFQVTKIAQTIGFEIPADVAATAPNITVAPSATSGLPVTVTSSTPGVCVMVAGEVDLLTTGVCTLIATQPGDGTFTAAAPVEVSFDVTPAAQSITLGPIADLPVNAAAFPVNPTSTSELPVTVTSATPDICTVADDVVSLTGAEGTCTLVADVPGDSTWSPATATVSFAVGRVSQTILFDPIGDQLATATDFPVTPAASSGLPVTVTSDTPDVCTVVDGVVDVLTDGVCTLTGTQPGNPTFVAADAVSVSFTVTKAPQVLTFPEIADRPLTAGDLTVAPTSDSGLPVVVTSDTPTVCPVVDGVVSFTGVEGVCTLTATQAGDATHLPTGASRSFLVARAWQGIVFPTPTDRDVTAVDFPVSPEASSGLPVTVTSTTPTVCSATGGVVDVLAPGACHLVGTQPGNTHWLPAELVEVQFTITKAAQAITFPPVPGRTSTDGPFPITATATSGLPVEFTSSTPDICSVADGVVMLTGTPGTCTLVADQPGDATWLPGEQVVRFFTVAAPTPTTPTTPTDPGTPTTPSAPTTPTVPTQTGTTTGTVAVPLHGVPGGTTVHVPATVPGAKKVTTTGTAVTVTPTKDFSGVITVPVTLTATDGTTTTTSVVITVNPKAPKEGVAQNRNINHSKLVWAKSATGSVSMYVVTIDGEVVCQTATTSCTPTHLVNRGSVIKVAALGNGGTRSQEIRLDYRKKLILAAVVHFPTSKWNLVADQRQIVTDTRAKAIKYGLTHMTVTGDTDSRGSKAYNKRLSAQRASVVVKELRRGGVKLKLVTKPRGEDTPTATNRTAAGMYANRRAEIWVW